MSFEAKAWKETEGPFLKDFNEKEAIDSVNGALALRPQIEKVIDQIWDNGFDGIYFIGIGGTYAAMPELYLAIFRLFHEGKLEQGREIQNECCRIIYKMCSAQGNMYAVIKEIIRLQGGPDVGGVRAPLLNLMESDRAVTAQAAQMIADAIAKYC